MTVEIKNDNESKWSKQYLFVSPNEPKLTMNNVWFFHFLVPSKFNFDKIKSVHTLFISVESGNLKSKYVDVYVNKRAVFHKALRSYCSFIVLYETFILPDTNGSISAKDSIVDKERISYY